MRIPLNIQLEFLDYNIGDYIQEYNAYYMGIYCSRIMLITIFNNTKYLQNIDFVIKEVENMKYHFNLSNDYRLLYSEEFTHFINVISDNIRFNYSITGYQLINHFKYYDCKNKKSEPITDKIVREMIFPTLILVRYL